MIWNSDKIFEGIFLNGKPHGHGVLYKNNTLRFGRW